MYRFSSGRIIGLLVCLVLPASASAQLISLKTVPIAAGDQFLIFPSENLAMGGPSIALDDRLLDPFVNPAPGVAFDNFAVERAADAAAASNDILLPPSGPLTLQDASVFTSQISISIPIR